MRKNTEVKVSKGATEKFDLYQKALIKTDICNMQTEVIPAGLIEKVLGLVGEAGEVGDKFKKVLRDENGRLTEENKAEIIKELGDVLWYTATIARYLGVPFSEVARANLVKMESRWQRGKISGRGDNR